MLVAVATATAFSACAPSTNRLTHSLQHVGAEGAPTSQALLLLHLDDGAAPLTASSAQAPGLKAMRPFCLRAREIEGSGTEGAIVAYYCAPPRRAAPRSARTQRRVIAGRCYRMQKAMAKGGLSKEDKMELLPIMDELEAVRPRS